MIEDLNKERDKSKTNLDACKIKIGDQADELAKLRQEKDKLVMKIEEMKQEHQKFQKLSEQVIELLKAEIRKQESKFPTNYEMTTKESEIPGPSNLHIKYVKK